MNENTLNAISKSEKNHEISFLKFVFSVVVVIGHMGSVGCFKNNSFTGTAAFAVEFFFIVSGYFMISSYMKKAAKNNINCAEETVKFMKHKIKGIAMPFLISVVFSILVSQINYMVFQHGTLKGLFSHIVRCIPDALGLIASGFYNYEINAVRWYISAMLIAMLFIYYFLCKYIYIYIYIYMLR